MEKFSYMVLVFKWNIINIQINLKNYYMYMQKNLIFLGDQAGCIKAKYTVSCLDIPGIQTAAKLPKKRIYEH